VANRALTGVLLVGGASTRFGSPKALAIFDGETLAERAWRLLGAACGERIAVGKNEFVLPFDVLDDGSDLRAPIVGVIAGLRAATHDVAVVIPVDMPQLTVCALHKLADVCRDVACPQTGPLPGAYRKSALAALDDAVAARRLALHEAIDGLEVDVVTLDEAVLLNVNTPDDVRRL
jgi:molybdopterin-guanine dinucleotide biosynthesis protein A